MSSPPKKQQKTVSLASAAVYVSVYNVTESSVSWYVLNTDARGDDITFSRVPQLYSPQLPMFFGCATLDSHIYLVGGQYKSITKYITYDLPCQDVHVFNTMSSRWMSAPPMQANRGLPVVIPLNKRLYVFGGEGVRWNQPWAEYLDLDCHNTSSHQTWHSLSSPPPEIRQLTQIDGHAVFKDGQSIVFWCKGLSDNAELYIIWCGSNSVYQLQVSFVKIRIKFEEECIVPEYVCSETFNIPGAAIFCCLGVQPHDIEDHKLVDDTALIPNAKSGDAVLRLKFEKMDLQEAKRSKVGGQQSLMEQLALFMQEQGMAGAIRIVEKTGPGVTHALESAAVGVKPKSSSPEIKVVKTVHDLLQSLGLQEYLPIFQENEIKMDTLTSMEDKGLRALNIPMGPRKKILHAVKSRG